MVAAIADFPSQPKVSASLQDTSINGLEGLNLNVAVPYKFQDYIVGFKYALGNFKKAPESLFASRTFDTPVDGSATVDADYNLGDNSLNVATKWTSSKLGLTVRAEGSTKDKLKTVGADKSLDVQDYKLKFTAAYDLLKTKLSGSAAVSVDKADVKVCYNTVDQDPVLCVNYAADANHDVSPTISLKSGELSCGVTRKWVGGFLKAKVTPNTKMLNLEWRDDGASGSWTTKADIPLENQANTKISFSRDWNY